jgi:hypothetical protein
MPNKGNPLWRVNDQGMEATYFYKLCPKCVRKTSGGNEFSDQFLGPAVEHGVDYRLVYLDRKSFAAVWSRVQKMIRVAVAMSELAQDLEGDTFPFL